MCALNPKNLMGGMKIWIDTRQETAEQGADERVAA
jgi:hypothetical protein